MVSRSVLVGAFLLAFCVFTLISSMGLLHSLSLKSENGFFRPDEPSLVSVLVYLLQSLPNATSSDETPPFRDVSYAVPRKCAPSLQNITLVTQISTSNLTLARVQFLAERWNGPISCAVYLSDLASIRELIYFLHHTTETFREHVTVHLMLEKKSPQFQYPINHLRNLALSNIDTDYFFYVDVDFIPGINAHTDLANFLSHKLSEGVETYSTLYVIPAFETLGEGANKFNTTVTSLDDMPSSKESVMSMLAMKKIQPFHFDYFKAGHAPTDFERWYNCSLNESYAVQYRGYFEPYVMGNRHGIPKFIEKFRGYGSNKFTWIKELRSSGYKFETFCGQFIVHMGHPGNRKRRQISNETKAASKWFSNEYVKRRYSSGK